MSGIIGAVGARSGFVGKRLTTGLTEVGVGKNISYYEYGGNYSGSGYMITSDYFTFNQRVLALCSWQGHWAISSGVTTYYSIVLEEYGGSIYWPHERHTAIGSAGSATVGAIHTYYVGTGWFGLNVASNYVVEPNVTTRFRTHSSATSGVNGSDLKMNFIPIDPWK